jgi:hypothetical protein
VGVRIEGHLWVFDGIGLWWMVEVEETVNYSALNSSTNSRACCWVVLSNKPTRPKQIRLHVTQNWGGTLVLGVKWCVGDKSVVEELRRGSSDAGGRIAEKCRLWRQVVYHIA